MKTVRIIVTTAGSALGALLARAALAQDKMLDSVVGATGGAVKKVDPAVFIGNLVRAFISLLGLIFLVLMIYGGFLWLKARGSKEEVTKAKETITQAVIGLIIVIAAYAISSFIISRVVSSAG